MSIFITDKNVHGPVVYIGISVRQSAWSVVKTDFNVPEVHPRGYVMIAGE